MTMPPHPTSSEAHPLASPDKTKHRRGRILAITTLAASIFIGSGLVAANVAFSAETPGDTSIRINQVGYAPGLKKHATVVSDSTSPLSWELRNASGTAVANGTSTVRGGTDATSGQKTHTVDFSSYQGTGNGFRLVVAGKSSHAFTITDGLYTNLVKDSLAFFYHQRSGIAIDANLVGSQYARPAGHLGISPNRGDTSVPCVSGVCDYSRDVRGGWYDAGDQGKYVVNGGIATWHLLNAYERSQHITGANRNAFPDGGLTIPERSNGVPDILDEARWEVEFLLRMQVPDDKTYAGMAFHKIHDQNWTGVPTLPDQDSQQRELHKPSTAATLNLAAIAAQSARIWKTIDSTFATTCENAATKAWTAAQANPSLFAPATDSTGGGPYQDSTVSDEFYWAAAELYLTTGSSTYQSALTSSGHYAGKSIADGFNWYMTAPLGDISLAVVPNTLQGVSTIRQAILSTADTLLANINGQAYPVPMKNTQFWWGSNGEAGNRAQILALANDFSQNAQYRDGALASLDYLLGRNPLGNSYVTGYGTAYSKNQHHRFWAKQANGSYPNPPAGSLAGGPNPNLEDPYASSRLSGCAPGTCYIDHYESYSTNEVAINWNASLAWLASYAAEKTTNTAPVTPSASPSLPRSPSASPSLPRSPSASPPVSPSRSASSSPSSPPSTSASAGSCSVAYKRVGQWPGGFQGDVTITNTSPATINGWTLTWSFPNGQTISSLWGGTASQNGAAVTVKNANYNGTVASNASVAIGFVGNWSTTNNAPSSFQLNGQTCTIL